MIRTRFISAICRAFPRGQISLPIEGASYVFDAEGDLIGHFDYHTETFSLYTDYEFYQQAKTSLTDNRVEFIERESDEAAKLFIKP